MEPYFIKSGPLYNKFYSIFLFMCLTCDGDGLGIIIIIFYKFKLQENERYLSYKIERVTLLRTGPTNYTQLIIFGDNKVNTEAKIYVNCAYEVSLSCVYIIPVVHIKCHYLKIKSFFKQ